MKMLPRLHHLIFVGLALLLGGLQYRLWVGEGSLAQVAELKEQVRLQQEKNAELLARNRLLAAEVMELKNGFDTVEEQARYELGMIKEGETLYQLADD